MMKRPLILLSLLLLALATLSQQAPREEVKGWHLMDPRQDGHMGISLDKAYALLKGRKSTPVIVAVIDSGIDTLQEDLKNILWVNIKEVNGNGKDDDGNGYIDDIYGWNFDGAKDGQNLSHNTHEIARVYHNWKTEFEGVKEKNVPADKKFLYNQWLKASRLINKDYEEAKKELPQYESFLKTLDISSGLITQYLNTENFGPAQVKSISATKESMLGRSVALWTDLFSQTTDTSVKNTAVIKEVTDFKNQLDNKIKRKTDTPEDWRGELTKDNYTDINDRYYGNNNLKEGSGSHGTLVSGVIGAERGNGIGIDGIADNVRIMGIRAVPGGDEHDKDVALAIRYAVDNGAKVVNMSFGKPVSPYKKFVDDAVKYAASKGVLLVHGCGNDGVDITTDVFYPNPVFLDGTRADNFLSVGASGEPGNGGYAASFSNYSKQMVDVFAPGVFIYSTAPDNGYVGADGTSLASPVAAGVAALLKSYFPDLTPAQIIDILKKSGTPVNEKVVQPGKEKKEVEFSSLSESGKIINAAAAVQMAIEMEQKN